MATNFTLCPEDLLLWQQRAPRASWWFRVSNTHPFINGGQPIAEFEAAPTPVPIYDVCRQIDAEPAAPENPHSSLPTRKSKFGFVCDVNIN